MTGPPPPLPTRGQRSFYQMRYKWSVPVQAFLRAREAEEYRRQKRETSAMAALPGPRNKRARRGGPGEQGP